MSFSFIADADRMEDLNYELASTAKDLTMYIENIYAKINDLNTVWSGEAYDAFKLKCESYRKSLEELPEVLNAFSNEFGTLGGDASAMALTIKSLLDCSDVFIAEAETNIKTVQINTRAKDANGAYIPPSGDYSDGIYIPSNTTLAKGQEAPVIGNKIYNDTINTKNNLAAEVKAIEDYKKENLGKILSLPPEQKDVVLNYINQQLVYRGSIIKQIETATTCGYFVTDGPIFNATSNSLTGNVTKGLGVSDQEAVDASVAAAKNINKNISELSTMKSIEAYLLDCGLEPIGG